MPSLSSDSGVKLKRLSKIVQIAQRGFFIEINHLVNVQVVAISEFDI